MTQRLYTALKWYAVIRGMWRGLTQPRPPRTLVQIDKILRELYIEPIRQVLTLEHPLIQFTHTQQKEA